MAGIDTGGAARRMYDPGQFNTDIYSRFQSRYRRQPNESEINSFKGLAKQHGYDFTGPASQDIYDKAMSYIDSLGPQVPAPTAPPAPTTPPPAGPTGPMAGHGPSGENKPAPTTPQFEWDDVPDAPAFEYPDFQQPSWDTLANNPAYQFRMKQGIQALEASKAAKGTAKSGEMLMALSEFGQGLASQEMNNIFNREAQSWQMNRDLARQEYDPRLLTWETRTGLNQRRRELEGDRAWQGTIYWNDDYRDSRDFEMRRQQWMSDDNFRRTVFASDDEFRRAVQSEADKWKREIMYEERLKWLADRGMS